MWRKTKKYNLNVALKVKKWDSNHKEPNLYFNILIFFLANCIILLGPAIFKHLVSAVLICTSHKATTHPPPSSFAQGSTPEKMLMWEQKVREPSSHAASSSACTFWGTSCGEMWQEGWHRKSLGSLASSFLMPQEQCLEAVPMLCLFTLERCCGSCQHPQKHFYLVFLWVSMVNHWQTSEVLQGLLGCTSHQGLTTHLKPCCHMWWTVEMDKWWNSWDRPLIQGHFFFLLAAKVRESTKQWQEIV